MKNTEWGAVAFLQHSLYGSRTNVRMNNNSNHITGYSAIEEAITTESTVPGVDGTKTINYYNTKSVVASTTGNITGVYDMSGGAWEFVMGVMLSSDNKTPCAGRDSTYTSGFSGPYCNTTGTASGHAFPEKKYYDTYSYETDAVLHNRRILGDATGEMGPYGGQTRQIGSWYSDEAWFVWYGNPWFYRGGAYVYGSGVGVFAFGGDYGNMATHGGFRLVLAI